MEGGGERVQRRHGQPEADAEKSRGEEQERKRNGRVRLEELTHDEQEHRDEAAAQTGEVHALRSEAAARATPRATRP